MRKQGTEYEVNRNDMELFATAEAKMNRFLVAAAQIFLRICVAGGKPLIVATAAYMSTVVSHFVHVMAVAHGVPESKVTPDIILPICEKVQALVANECNDAFCKLMKKHTEGN